MRITHRLEPGHMHTRLTIWVEGANIGTLTVRNDEVEVLDSIVNAFVNVQALKRIGNIVSQVPTPDESEFGEEWPMRCDHVATAVAVIVHEALENQKPMDAEKAVIQRACAWLKSFAKELSARGQRDEGSPESSHKGAVRALAVREAAEQMSKALL